MHFNPRSLTGATTSWINGITVDTNFNPRSLTGATTCMLNLLSRSRGFQSSLPHGSDGAKRVLHLFVNYFNRRSLTGATIRRITIFTTRKISILAPSRERPLHDCCVAGGEYFNPRSLTGATYAMAKFFTLYDISILAPSRERRHDYFTSALPWQQFQSSLPHGSDLFVHFRDLLII